MARFSLGSSFAEFTAKFTVTNTRKDDKTIDSPVEKVWVGDNDGSEGLRTEIVVELKDGVTYYSSKEENKVVTVIVKDTSIEEENKNAYKFTIEDKKITKTETVLVE